MGVGQGRGAVWCGRLGYSQHSHCTPVREDTVRGYCERIEQLRFRFRPHPQVAPCMVSEIPNICLLHLDEGNGSGSKPRADGPTETEPLGPTTQSHRLARSGDAVEDRERDNDDGEERLR